ncbi:MAG TPA: class I SAM-dependent methyltransferase [Candidatus Methanomethylophilaceae archaeon]|nr:class I SAM-dependent methyltransferase [Candidatus Methanomethylophilaceae archaeon]
MAVHPLDGNMPESEKIKFWDAFSETYTSEQQGRMPQRIVEWLAEIDVIGNDKDLLEIGSGPGTYSLIMSKFSKTVSCLDSSGKMLDRLFATAKKEGINNLERMETDWNTYNTERRWDTVVSALCSGLGTPESIDRMDSLSKGNCVIISWVENHGDDIQSEIWSKLGKDYSYRKRSTNDIVNMLESSGRKVVTREFSDEIKIEIPVEEAIRKQTGTFSVFGLEKEARVAAEEVLAHYSVDGLYKYEAVNTLRATVWEPLRM